jgi:tetratricopeptide (TPR) repeat protein
MSHLRRALVLTLLSAAVAGCGPAPSARRGDPEDAALTSEEVLSEYRAAARAAWVKGTFLRERGELEGALQLYREAVRLAPRDASLRLALATLQLEVGRGRDARELLESAIQRFGGSSGEHLLLAQMDLLAGRPERALAGADSALAHEPGRVDAWVLRARLLMEAGRLKDALDSFRRADRLSPHDAAVLDGMGECLAALGRAQDAEAAWTEALQVEPTRDSARRALADLYRKQGRAEDAKRLVRDGLEINPDSPAALDAALESHLQSGDLQSAPDLLESLRARGALTPRHAYLYGRVLLQQDRVAEADSVLRPLAALEGLRGVETMLGDIAVRQDRPADAKRHYQRAVDRDPEDCVPAVSLALLEIQQLRDEHGRVRRDAASTEQAQRALEAAAHVTEPQEYRCNLLLGLAYGQLRRFDLALPHLEATHALEPRNSEVLFNLATAHQELGHFSDALRLARELLEQEPDDAAALNFVGYIQAERGLDLEKSEAMIRRALEQEPENGYYVDSLGWVLYQKGDYDRAAAELERAVRLTEERDAIILEHLGDAYSKLGRLDVAQNAYARSRRIDPTNRAVADKLAQVEARLGRP